ncbi:hypothetical protein F4805DRAFT_394770 [Annulohypoxylon moriforme]|nr:hypothetical protein F4805DRAFT_394770 [Annulohypoxylon moriforme]
MPKSNILDTADDFPAVYHLDPKQGLPVTRRWPGLNPFHHYIGGTGVARPDPSHPRRLASEAIGGEPSILPDITPYQSSGPNSSAYCPQPPLPRMNASDTELTAVQRRRYRLDAHNIGGSPRFSVNNGEEVDSHHLTTDTDRQKHKDDSKQDSCHPYGYDHHDHFLATRNSFYEFLDLTKDYNGTLRGWYPGVPSPRPIVEDKSLVWVDSFQPKDPGMGLLRTPPYRCKPKTGGDGMPGRCRARNILDNRRKSGKLGPAIMAPKQPPQHSGGSAVCGLLPIRPAAHHSPPVPAPFNCSQTGSYVLGRDGHNARVSLSRCPSFTKNRPSLKRPRPAEDEDGSEGGHHPIELRCRAPLRPVAKRPRIKLVGAWAAYQRANYKGCFG